MKKSSEPAQNTKSTKANQRTTLSQPVSKKKLGIIIVGIIVFLFGLGVIGKMTGVLMTSEQEKMQTYLEEKYGEKFVVERTYKSGGGVGIIGAIYGDVRPQGEPSVKFEIRRPENNNEYEYDTYIQALWTHQAKSEASDFLKTNIPGLDYYILKVNPINHFIISAKEKIPSFKEVRKKYPNNFSYSLTVASTATTEIEPSTKQLENTLKVIDFIKKINSLQPELYYAYKDIGYKEKDKAGSYLYQYRIHINKEVFSQIKTSDDLKNYFEKL